MQFPMFARGTEQIILIGVKKQQQQQQQQQNEDEGPRTCFVAAVYE